MKKDRLVICDLDGTLFDTRKVNYMAYKEAVEKSGLAFDLSYEQYLEKCWGPTYRTFMPFMGVPGDRFEEVHDLKKTLYEKNLPYARENAHLFDIVEALRPTHYTAVVTSGSRNAKDILRYFNRCGLFDAVFTIEDVKQGKPDPEGFFKAMEHFGMEGKNTLIFEDSDVGVAAARMTGAAVCIVDGF